MTGIKQNLKLEFPLHVMVWPLLLIVVVYCYLPMLGFAIAFQNFIPASGFSRSQWIGWSNFEYVYNMPDISRVIFNTVYIAFMKIVANLIVPIVIALLLNEVTQRLNPLKRMFQTMIYFPHFISWVLLGGIVMDMLSPESGIVNTVLKMFGLEPIYFLTSNAWFPYVLVVTDVWKEFGFGTIIFLAAITGINPSLYEAAIVDGARRLRQTWHVTLPGMRPIIALMAILSLGNVLNAGFDQVFNLYNPLTYESGDILDTLIYRTGIVNAQYSVATAIGIFKSVVSLLLISVSYYCAYKFANYRIF